MAALLASGPEILFGIEHVEVGLGHPQNQILACLLQLRFGEGGLMPALTVLHPVLPAKAAADSGSPSSCCCCSGV